MKKLILLIIIIIVFLLTLMLHSPNVNAEPLEVSGKYYYTEEDVYWLSRVIFAEARGESEKGKYLVGYVVMNRVKDSGFKNTVKHVIFEKGQFSCVDNKAIYKEPSEECKEIAIKILENPYELDEEILYFYNPKYTSRGNWIRTKPIIIEEGNHVFCKE